MKIKSLAKVCASNHTVAICAHTDVDDGQLVQYIGNGHAIYAVRGLPRMNKDAMLTLFDVKEKDKSKWYAPEGVTTGGFDMQDTTDDEQPLRWELPCVHSGGAVMMPLETEEGDLYFIDKMYIAPVNQTEDMLGLFLRRTEGGSPYVVAKDGFMFQAAIMPIMINEDFVARLKRLWGGCTHMLEDRE